MSNENIENKETKTNIDKNKINKIVCNFITTFQEFMGDLKNVYPEYKDALNKNVLKQDNIEINAMILEHFMMAINPYLIQISEKDESIFKNEEEKIVILKDVDFNVIWSKSNDMNKEIIWKYLHTLILIGNNYNGAIKKDGIFKQFNEMLSQSELDDESLSQISDQAKAMLNMVKSLSEENSEKNTENNENKGENLAGGMFENTKIGEIAKELASEINFDDFSKNLGSIGDDENPDPSKLFDNLIGKDPMKLMGLIQNVGTKIQDKISNGQINEQELVSEAQNMMQGLQDNPLFKGMNGEGINSVFSNGMASSLFGGNGGNDDELDDLDKDINQENSESSSFNPDNIRKMGFNSLFSKLGGGGGGGGDGDGKSSNQNNPIGNLGDMMQQMMSDPSMQQMMQQMSQDPNMQQMAQQMHQGGSMGNMNDMMSQMLNNPNMQQMAQQMAGNSNMQQMAQQMSGNPNMEQMAQQMAGNTKSKVHIDKNKIKKESTRDRLRQKLEKRKKEQEKNLYK